MAKGMTLKGWDKLQKDFDDMIVRAANQIRDVRAEVVNELVERLIENIPVWSGRTIASLWVDKAGFDGSVPVEHPVRGGFSIEGRYTPAPKEYGQTSKMAMGSEPMRRQAEAHARAQISKGRQDIWSAPVIAITISSVPWGLIEQGAAPGGPNQRARNRGIVSAIAIAAVKSKFAGVLK